MVASLITLLTFTCVRENIILPPSASPTESEKETQTSIHQRQYLSDKGDYILHIKGVWDIDGWSCHDCEYTLTDSSEKQYWKKSLPYGAPPILADNGAAAIPLKNRSIAFYDRQGILIDTLPTPGESIQFLSYPSGAPLVPQIFSHGGNTYYVAILEPTSGHSVLISLEISSKEKWTLDLGYFYPCSIQVINEILVLEDSCAVHPGRRSRSMSISSDGKQISGD